MLRFPAFFLDQLLCHERPVSTQERSRRQEFRASLAKLADVYCRGARGAMDAMGDEARNGTICNRENDGKMMGT